MKFFLIIIFWGISLSFFKAQEYSIKQIDSLVSYGTDFSEKAPANGIQLNEKNYKIAQRANYPIGMVKSLSALSVCYLSRGNYEKALQYAKQTEKDALEIKDYKSMCTGLRISAVCYLHLGLDRLSEEKMSKAFYFADKIADPDDFYETKGNLYLAKADIIFYGKNLRLSEFFKQSKNAIGEFIPIKNNKTRNNTLSVAYANLGLFYRIKKMPDSANYFMKESLDLAEISGNTVNKSIALYGLASIACENKEYQKAIGYLEIVIPVCKKINEQFLLKLAYKTMQECYEHLGNNEKKYEYLLKYTKLNDSLVKSEELTKDRSVQKIITENEKGFIGEKKNLYFLIVSIFLLLVLISYFAYKALRKYNEEKKEKLQKENVIAEKESRLTEMNKKVNNAFEEVIELARKNDPSFLARFTEVYPDFIEKLITTCPVLTSGQLKFCGLLKLNFSTKEIAYYTSITTRGVEIKKNRLRKQLGISSSEDLNTWMMNF
ncbi:tetratricopeptide repeat protein [Chryseobacterium sp. IT-36CA2]|uniref:tetratricopeptide repeat protein n=1 Tax=Chryseobacterium sp. IT-36CA2 TaxID=3026460 RepID=UPI0039E152D8